MKKLTFATACGVALLAAALVLQNRPVSWTQRVTDEALHAPNNHWPRPSLGPDGGTGHFGDVLATEWSALGTLDQNWQHLPHDAQVDCVRSASGASGEPLPAACRAWFDGARRRLAVIERATLTAQAGPPDRFDPLRGDDVDNAGSLLVVGRIPALETVVREAEATTPEGHGLALDACVIALSVARDLQWGNALAGYGYSYRVAGLTFYSCAKALRQATPERRAQFRDQLDRVDAGRPPLVHGFALERTLQLLTMFGGTLSDRTLERVDERLKARLQREHGAWRDAELKTAWPVLSRAEDAMVAAAQEPADRRDVSFRAKPGLLGGADGKLDPRGYESYRSVDAIFQALRLLASPAETTLVSRPVSITRVDDGLFVKLELRDAAMTYTDGGVFTLPSEWTFRNAR